MTEFSLAFSLVREVFIMGETGEFTIPSCVTFVFKDVINSKLVI